MQLAEFDYALPDELIARYPATERRMSRLLVVDAGNAQLADRQFGDLLQYFRAGDLLVLNDTRVVPARLRGKKASGGRVELLIERVLAPCTALVQLRASKSPGASVKIEFAEGHSATVIGRRDEFYELEFSSPVEELLESLGEVPLPPYLGRANQPSDRERYQTVYARHPGAVAAPTAGLHFDEQMLVDLQNAGVGIAFVTLHVGAGTFSPLRQESVSENRLHPERVQVSEAVCQQVNETRAAGGRIVAVGTTSVRALEAASANGAIEPFDGETDLFIQTGLSMQIG
jgi:S-adenosylmethionine:tRNA ribosyltransferase-isomerase